jgi:hypothetical protein
MKKEMIKVEAVKKLKLKACGTVTCIHNVNSKCLMKTCEMYERSFRQEGI